MIVVNGIMFKGAARYYIVRHCDGIRQGQHNVSLTELAVMLLHYAVVSRLHCGVETIHGKPFDVDGDVFQRDSKNSRLIHDKSGRLVMKYKPVC